MQQDVSTMMMVSSPPVLGANGLPCAPDGARLAPSLFVDLPYSPALLLDAGLGAELTDHTAFAPGCEGGYAMYFDALCDWNKVHSALVLVDHWYTWSEVERVVGESVIRRYDLSEQFWGVRALPWRVGYVLGWLSALALSDYGLALRGLAWLHQVVRVCLREEGAQAWQDVPGQGAGACSSR
jgi:hypothetical protein